jgi:hypothetical protein
MAKKPFRYFKTSPEIIQLGVPQYALLPLSRRNVDDLPHRSNVLLRRSPALSQLRRGMARLDRPCRRPAMTIGANLAICCVLRTP